jgi:hypothetical protein
MGVEGAVNVALAKPKLPKQGTLRRCCWREYRERVVSSNGRSSSAAAHLAQQGSITFEQIAVLKVVISPKETERSSAVYSGNLVTGEL